MYHYLQGIKDFCAIPVFIYLSLFHHSRYFLAVFFSAGCLLDTLFTAYAYWYDKPWTIARIKDACGAFGMFVFTLALLTANPSKDPGRWPYFFQFAAAVDTLSVLSICSQYNIYTKNMHRWHLEP